MDKLDEQLHQLILETCCHPCGSLKRQKGLNQIVWHIQQSGKLLRGLEVPDYEDALQQTWLYLCRNLCEATTGNPYDPQQASVITWINAYLKRRLQDSRQTAITQKRMIATRFPLKSKDYESLDPVDYLVATPEPPPILQEIREWVQQEGAKLRRIHVRDRPDINCQVLILRRLPPEVAWEDLSKEFGVSIATLSNFYQRECFPRLLNFGKSQGYIEQ